ncbi:MAG: sensor histidine kinase [Gemmatimonadales bacterium]
MRKRFRLLPDDRTVGWTPYAWLVYFPTLFLQPAMEHAPTFVWVITAIVGIIFLALYFRCHWAHGREANLIIASIVALGAVLALFNVSGFVLFIYAAGFAGTHLQTRRALQAFAAFAALILLEAFVLHLPLFAWVWAVVLVWMIGGVNAHYATVRKGNAVLRQAREEIEHLATVAERERIARDLHDLLGHTLSLITLKSSLASRLADRDPARAVAEIRDVERISREALSEVRSAVAGYREAGLARAVASAEQMLAAAGIEHHSAIDDVSVSPSEEGVLALAVREAVTNVVKHSRATSCTISFSREGAMRRLTVGDNGHWTSAPDGNGLAGMRERVDAIGGQLSVAHDGGTKLVIDLPDSEQGMSQVHIVA